MGDLTIRRAEAADIPALLEIYNYYVINTHITFDIVPRTLDQRIAWFTMFGDCGRFQCFAAVRGRRAVGWASSAPFRERAAYATSVETSAYLAPDEVGRGLGGRLYCTLFDALKMEDVHRAYGGVSLPNDASVALHERMGFRQVGIYREVGRKFGRFWDVAVYERTVLQGPRNPPAPLI